MNFSISPSLGITRIQPGYCEHVPSIPIRTIDQGNGVSVVPSQTITLQPGASAKVWMSMPQSIHGVPQGLEYLILIDTIVVHQLYEMLEMLTDFETKNKYMLKNANGEQVYYAIENSGCCQRQCCRNQRGFSMHILDNFKREVMIVNRPFKCCGGGCFGLVGFECCGQEATIEAPPGNILGSVRQRTACCSLGLDIRDAKGTTVLEIQGPCCCVMCGCQDKEYAVNTLAGQNVGAITKKWGGCLRETFSDSDVFRVNFPMDLDVKLKAVLIGATFLIDFMEFEHTNNRS